MTCQDYFYFGKYDVSNMNTYLYFYVTPAKQELVSIDTCSSIGPDEIWKNCMFLGQNEVLVDDARVYVHVPSVAKCPIWVLEGK